MLAESTFTLTESTLDSVINRLWFLLLPIGVPNRARFKPLQATRHVALAQTSATEYDDSTLLCVHKAAQRWCTCLSWLPGCAVDTLTGL
jgi:hypothetical protein